MMKISSRRLRCPQSIACGDWCFPLLLDERVDICKDNILCNNVYKIKTLVFYIHILAVCMTT
jgi:hypothetical protein